MLDLVQSYSIKDFYPNEIYDGRIYIEIGDYKHDMFVRTKAKAIYLAAKKEHNAIKVTTSCLSKNYKKVLALIKESIDSDILKEGEDYIIFSIFGLKTDLPICY